MSTIGVRLIEWFISIWAQCLYEQKWIQELIVYLKTAMKYCNLKGRYDIGKDWKIKKGKFVHLKQSYCLICSLKYLTNFQVLANRQTFGGHLGPRGTRRQPPVLPECRQQPTGHGQLGQDPASLGCPGGGQQQREYSPGVRCDSGGLQTWFVSLSLPVIFYRRHFISYQLSAITLSFHSYEFVILIYTKKLGGGEGWPRGSSLGSAQ